VPPRGVLSILPFHPSQIYKSGNRIRAGNPDHRSQRWHWRVSCPPIRLLSSLPVRHNILDLPFPFVCPSRFVLTPFQLLRLVLAARSRDKLKKVALKCRNFGCEVLSLLPPHCNGPLMDSSPIIFSVQVAIVPTDVSKPKQCKCAATCSLVCLDNTPTHTHDS